MSWRKLYDSCVCETNPVKLEKLVFELEDAIVLRYHDLAGKPNQYEFHAITRAAELLRQLKIEKLGWPDPAKQEFHFLWINWRAFVNRIQAALLVAERAWQNWVFKSLEGTITGVLRVLAGQPLDEERDAMKDVVLKYPIWQEPYRVAVIEPNPQLLKQRISAAQQAVILRLKQLENSEDHHHELVALTDALSALKILAETTWA